MNAIVSRRDFLKGSLASGLTIAVSVTPLGYTHRQRRGKEASRGASSPNVWVQITADNKVTITVGQFRDGTGRPDRAIHDHRR